MANEISQMKEYDLAFSLGSTCGTSQALRAAGLQYASYPLDWLGTRGVVHMAEFVAGGFDRWFEKEDFELVDVWHGTGFGTRAYLNKKTQIGFSHEFSDFMPFDESFPRIRETYERRVARFMEKANAAKRMLVAFVEFPNLRHATLDEIAEARRVLSEKFPAAWVDILYVGVEEGKRVPELKEVSPGVFMADYDYRKFDEKGAVLHYINWERLVPLLRANFRVPDTRSKEQKKNFAAGAKISDRNRWGLGVGPFRAWLNKHMYKTYRSVEQILIKRGLVQKEGPFWFWEDMRIGSKVAR